MQRPCRSNNLRKQFADALLCLGQTSPPDTDNVQILLNWAIENWQPDMIPVEINRLDPRLSVGVKWLFSPTLATRPPTICLTLRLGVLMLIERTIIFVILGFFVFSPQIPELARE